MTGSSYGNAMTEIALALAMAFFSIMVLTMVSMSAAPSGSVERGEAAVLELAKNAPAARPADGAGDPRIVIFWRGAFLDRNLNPVAPSVGGPEDRVILALPPNLPVNEALSVRARFGAGDVVVSTLDRRWLDRLGAPDDKDNSP